MKDLPDVRLNVLPIVLGSSGRGDNQFMKELTRGTCRNKPLQRQKTMLMSDITFTFFFKDSFHIEEKFRKEEYGKCFKWHNLTSVDKKSKRWL